MSSKDLKVQAAPAYHGRTHPVIDPQTVEAEKLEGYRESGSTFALSSKDQKVVAALAHQ